MSWVCTEMDGSPCNIKAPCLAMPTVPLLSAAPALLASRPSALPSRWHFKAGMQTWQAWLSAWSQPPHPHHHHHRRRHHPLLPPSLSLPPTAHSTPLPTPSPPQRLGSYPCWARSAPRSTPLAASGAAVKKLFPTSLINNGPFLMQALWICSLLPSDPIGEFWGLDRRQTRRGGLVGAASKSFEFGWLGFTCIILHALEPLCCTVCMPARLPVSVWTGFFFKDVSLLQMIGDTRTKEHRGCSPWPVWQVG